MSNACFLAESSLCQTPTLTKSFARNSPTRLILGCVVTLLAASGCSPAVSVRPSIQVNLHRLSDFNDGYADIGHLTRLIERDCHLPERWSVAAGHAAEVARIVRVYFVRGSIPPATPDSDEARPVRYSHPFLQPFYWAYDLGGYWGLSAAVAVTAVYLIVKEQGVSAPAKDKTESG